MRRAIERIHRILVAMLVPRRIRRRFGDDLRRTFELALEDALRERRVGRLLLRELRSLLETAVGARWGVDARRRGRRPRRTMKGGRGMWTMRADDVRHALRSLRRSPGQMAFIVATLGLAIGASTTIYSAARHTVLSPLPYEEADRMVGVYRRIGDFGLVLPTVEMVERWTASPDVFESAEAYGIVYWTLTGHGDPVVLDVARVSRAYFPFLGVEPALGRAFTGEEVVRGDRVVLLGHELWQRRFGGDPGIVGSVVTLDGDPWTVIGVGPKNAPPPMSFSDRADLWAPLDREQITTAVALLAHGVTVREAQERLDRIVAREHEEGVLSTQFQAAVLPPRELVGGRLEDALGALGVAVGLLLLMACLNVGGLLVTRADARRHETALRIALGIGGPRLLRQQLLESLLLALAATVGGVGVAFLGVHAVRRFRPEDLASLDRMTLDPPVLLFSIGVAVVAGLLYTLMPAFTVMSRKALGVLRTGIRGRTDRGTARLRWMLVVGEIALSFAMLVGSGLLVRTVRELSQRDPGFRIEGLVIAEVDLPSWKYGEDERPALWRRFEALIESLPGVSRVALTSGVPTRPGVFFGDLQIEGREISEAGRRAPFFGSSVTPEYFEVLGNRIVSGRTFGLEEIEGERSAYIVGASAARELWPDGDAVGGRMRLDDEEWGLVVGVVDDVVGAAPGSRDGGRQLYAPLREDGLRGWERGWLAVRTSRPAATITNEIRRALRGAEPDLVVEIGPIEAYVSGTLSAQRFTMVLLIALAVVAGLLSCLGLYGVVSHVVGRRTREIGIRMSLGAGRGSIARMVLRSGMTAIAVGIGVGTAVAAGAVRVIASQLFGVEPDDPLTYLGSGTVLALAALLAIYLPARKAARTDPVRAITTD